MKNSAYLIVFDSKTDTLPDKVVAFLKTMPSHRLNNTTFIVRTSMKITELSAAIESETRLSIHVSVFAVADEFVLRGTTTNTSRVTSLVDGP